MPGIPPRTATTEANRKRAAELRDEGLTSAEIARRLGISVSSVRTCLNGSHSRMHSPERLKHLERLAQLVEDKRENLQKEVPPCLQ